MAKLAKALSPVTDVSLATDDELVGELFRRIPTAIVAGIDPRKTGAIFIRFSGGAMAAMGLCSYCKQSLFAAVSRGIAATTLEKR